MSFKKDAVSGTKWTTLSKIIRSIFLLLQIAILTRYLEKSDFGLVAMCMVVINFTTIFVDAGFTSAILFKQDSTPEEYSSIYWSNLFLAVLLFGILYMMTPWVATFYKEPRLAELLPILGLNIIFIAVGRLHLTIMQKSMKFKKLAFIDIASVLLGLVAASFLAISEFGIYSLIYSTLVVGLSSSVMGLVANLKENRIRFHFRLREIRSYAKVGGYNFGGLLIGFFSSEIDTLIVGKLLGASSLGLYDLAKNIASKFYGIISPILTKVLTPILAVMQQNKSELKRNFNKILYLIPYLAVPLYLALILGAKEVLGLLYGLQYMDGYIVLSFTAVFYCISTIYNPIISLQVATGNTKLGFIWTLLCLLIYPVGVFLSAPFGIEYVAMSRAAIAICLIYLMWRIQVKPIISITWLEFFNTFSKPLLLLLFIAGVFLVFRLSGNTGNLYIDLFLNVFAGLLLYGLALFVWDKKMMKNIFAQLQRGVLNK